MLDFKEILDISESCLLVTDSQLKVEYISSSAKEILNFTSPPEDSPRLTELMSIRTDDLDRVGDHMLIRKSVQFYAFLRDQEDSDKLIEKAIVGRAFGTKKQGRYIFIIQDGHDSGCKLEHIRKLGVLTGDMAHAISNPLAVVQLNCDSLSLEFSKKEPPDIDVVLAKVGRMSRALGRVADETGKLKILSTQLSSLSEKALDELMALDDFDQHH